MEVLTMAFAGKNVLQKMVFAQLGKHATQKQMYVTKIRAKPGKIVTLWSAKTDNALNVYQDGMKT